MEVFIKAQEYMEMPVRRTDEEPLQKLFVSVRSELNLDMKNIRTEQAKFWKQHPPLVKVIFFPFVLYLSFFFLKILKNVLELWGMIKKRWNSLVICHMWVHVMGTIPLQKESLSFWLSMGMNYNCLHFEKLSLWLVEALN